MTQPSTPKNTIQHQAFFWLNRPGNAEDRAALIAGLRTLANVPHVQSLRITIPANTESRDVVDASWDVSELMLFDCLADQKAYQDHPLHLAFVEQCGALWARVVVYDGVAV